MMTWRVLLRRRVWIVTWHVLIVEIERTVIRCNALVYIPICCFTNGWLIEVVNEGGIIEVRLDRLLCICVICWWLLFITLSCWSFRTTWVNNTTTTWILWIGKLFLCVTIECVLCVSHSCVILLVVSSWLIGFSLRSLLLAKPWRSVIWWTFVKSNRSECLSPSHWWCIRNNRPSTAVRIVPCTKLWVSRINAEVTTIWITSIVALTFTPAIPYICFTSWTSFTTSNTSVRCWCRILHCSVFVRFWWRSRHFLPATQDRYMLLLLWLIRAYITIICCWLCILLNLFPVQLLYLGLWICPVNDTLAKCPSFFITTNNSLSLGLLLFLLSILWILLL